MMDFKDGYRSPASVMCMWKVLWILDRVDSDWHYSTAVYLHHSCSWSCETNGDSMDVQQFCEPLETRSLSSEKKLFLIYSPRRNLCLTEA